MYNTIVFIVFGCVGLNGDLWKVNQLKTKLNYALKST